MGRKCSYLDVLGEFFLEPTGVHFIKGISRKIGLAPVSVRNNINELLKQGLIKRKKARPFDGFAANRENADFIFYKRVYNLYLLKQVSEHLASYYSPKMIAVFGSYSRGEDVEESDIDIVVIAAHKAEPALRDYEKKLGRKIHCIAIDSIDRLDMNIRKKVWNGIVLYGGF